MAGNAAETPPFGRPQSDSSGAQDAGGEPGDRYGLLAVVRHRKDDGRALILYSRAEATA